LAKTFVFHLTGEPPILGEIEEEISITATSIRIINARRTDGKDLTYLDPKTQAMIIPWHRVTFLEELPSEQDRDQVIGFFRES